MYVRDSGKRVKCMLFMCVSVCQFICKMKLSSHTGHSRAGVARVRQSFLIQTITGWVLKDIKEDSDQVFIIYFET